MPFLNEDGQDLGMQLDARTNRYEYWSFFLRDKYTIQVLRWDSQINSWQIETDHGIFETV